MNDLFLIKIILILLIYIFHSRKFRVDHNTSAIFTNDNFLTHFDIELSLRWNTIETPSTRVALNINHCQTIACVLTNSLKCRQQTRLYFIFKFLGLFPQLFFILFGLRNNFIKFAFLFIQNMLAIL